MRFGLMFFAANEEALGENKYHLLIESAKFGDQHEFSSIWVPERHFTRLGSLYPNPAVLHAALARETKRIDLRAGSVVLPLHHPLRVAEEWAVVDNLSGGRVGISFASGWNPTDFAFFPERYQNRHNELLDAIQTVQKLWQGEPISVTSGNGQQTTVRIYPTPVQPKLPIWVTAAGNPQTFMAAGALGANLLTHVLDQSIETLAEKIALYRQARAAHGHDPAAGLVSAMIHTFVGGDADVVCEQARAPYCQYLKSNIGLLKGLAQSRGQSFDITTMPAEDIDSFVNLLYDRFATTRGLIGTPDTCLDVVRQLAAAGVDEVACLLDFGPDAALILQNLPYLKQLKERWAAEPARNSRHSPVSHTQAPARAPAADRESLADIRARCAQAIPSGMFYDDLRRYGVQMESAFQGIQGLWRHDREALGLVRLPDALAPSAGAYTLHPAFLDACLQVFVAALPPGTLLDSGALYLPVGLRGLRVHGRAGRQVWSHAMLRSASGSAETAFEGDVRVFDEAGKLLVEIDGLRLQRVEAARPGVREHLDAWLYDIRWHPRPLAEDLPEQAPGLWIVFADQSGVAARLIARLKERGETCLAVVAGAHTSQVDPTRPDDLRQILRDALAPGRPPCCGIVHLWSLDMTSPDAITTASLERDQALGVVSVLHLVQALHTLGASTPRLWLVTRGAQPAAPDGAPPALAQAPLWGFGRTIPLELPHLQSGLIDLDGDATPEEAAEQLFSAVWRPDQEDQIAFRAGQRLVARIERDRDFTDARRGLNLRPDATYLITGGLGNLGLHYARWMVECGARQLVLLGRRGASGAVHEAVEQLERMGARVLVARADVAELAAMTGIFDELADSWPPLRGIIHAAGVTGYQPIGAMDAGGLLDMLRPKVLGTWVLHQLSRTIDLDFFVCISSLSPIWGTKGLAHYAAANHFLDIFGHYGRRRGLPTTTVNLGPLAGGGMVAATTAIETAMTQSGLLLLEPGLALDIVEAVAGAGAAQKIVADVDWTTFQQLHEMSGARPLLESVSMHAAAEQAGGPKSAFLLRLEQVAPREREERLIGHIQGEVAHVLKLDPSRRPDPQQGFFDMGMDSLMVLDFKTRLQNSLGYTLPSTLPFEYPTIEALTAYLLDRLFEPSAPDEIAALPQEAGQPDDLANIKALSESELKALIDAELEMLIDE